MSRHDPDPSEADTTPLRVAASTGTSHTLRRLADHLLVIRPILFFPLLGVFVGVVFTLIGAGILFTAGHMAGGFIGGIGVIITVAFALLTLLTRRFEFDRQAGEWRVLRRIGSGRRYPLEQIRAVQLIPGGWHGGHGNRPQFYTYQCNLVLADPDRPRLNLTNVSNWEATWRIGSDLADFLGVRLLDEVSE